MTDITRTVPRNLRIAAFLAIGLVLASASSPALARAYWYETYEQVVELIDQGRALEASPILAQLIAEQPEPEATA